MAETRRHILIWVSAEFLQSEGMLHILQEAGFLPGSQARLDKFFESLELIGGFALTGALVDVHHGAGIWISPQSAPELELMVPWNMVRCVLTAAEPRAATLIGLSTELARRKAARSIIGKKTS